MKANKRPLPDRATDKHIDEYDYLISNDFLPEDDLIASITALACNGSILAMTYLGDHLARRRKTYLDLDPAAAWYQRAADAGSLRCLNKLASIALMRDQYDKYIALLEKTYNNNYAPAMYELGNCYNYGEFVEIDHIRARHLLEAAFDAGFYSAGRQLMVLDLKGRYGFKMLFKSIINAPKFFYELALAQQRGDWPESPEAW